MKKTSPKSKAVMVWLNLEEKDEIENRAKRAGLSQSGYLRALALNIPISFSKIPDTKIMSSLACLNGEIARIADILQAWLLNKGEDKNPRDVEKSVQDLRILQDRVVDIMGQMIRDR